MTKSDLIKRLAANPHLIMRDVERVVATVFTQIGVALARRYRVELRGFGAFSTRARGGRAARNPRTGDEVAVPGKAVPHFRTGKELHGRLQALDGEPPHDGHRDIGRARGRLERTGAKCGGRTGRDRLWRKMPKIARRLDDRLHALAMR